MQATSLFASAVDAARSHAVSDALPYLMGLCMVLVSLAFLWGVCVVTAKVIAAFVPTVIPDPAPHQPPVPAAPAGSGSTIVPEFVAVIAAAVATATRGTPVRIVSIKPMSSSWERAGRQSVLTSHRIR
jgi:Na+-transporting methylmalonyl-CoA/oxaloacetate decarboxylase gamma subunit